MLTFWSLLNTGLAGILLRMVMHKLHIVQNHWKLLIRILTERSFTWGLLLRRQEELGGYLRWTMTWTRNSFPQVWQKKKKKLKFLFRSSYLQSAHTLPGRRSWQLGFWRLLGTLVNPVKGSNAKGRKPNGMCCLHVDDMFNTGAPELTVQDWSWRCERLAVHRSMCQVDHWSEDQKNPHNCWTVIVCVSEPTEIVMPKGFKDEDTCDKDLQTAYRSLLGPRF